jgi:hypothetical protein
MRETKRRNKITKAQKDRAKEKIYEKRHEFQKLREAVKILTEEQKQSEEYRSLVALVNERLEKKRLENMKYRECKLAYSRRKRDEKIKHRMQYDQTQQREDNELAEELANYHFEIFDRFSMFDYISCATF